MSAALSLFIIPPPQPLDWSTPSNLTRSIARNFGIQLFHPPGHYVGHVNVELRTPDGNTELTGQTSDSDVQYHLSVLTHGMGFGSIVANSCAGRLFRANEILKEHRLRFRTGEIRIVHFLIGDKTAEMLRQFLYRYRKLGHHLRFAGLASNPLLGQDAGCTSFAIALLKLAGVFTTEMAERWKRELIVSHEWLRTGGPKFWHLVLDSRYRWADGHGGVKFTFWDPELMIRWFDDLFESTEHVYFYDQAPVIELDQTSIDPFSCLTPGEKKFVKREYGLSAG